MPDDIIPTTTTAGTLTRRHDSEEASALVRAAVESKLPADAIERLVNLQLKLDDRRALAECNAAIRAFRRDCPDLVKAKTVDVPTKDRAGIAYSFKQETLASVRHLIDPVLDRHGLTLTFDQGFDDKGRLVCTCIVTHDGGGVHRGTFVTPVSGSPTMSEFQKTGGTLSGAMRYAIRAALGLRFAEDDEDRPDVAPSETITAEKAANVRALMQEVGAHEGRFLAVFGVRSVDDLLVSHLPVAVKMLEAKRKGG